MGLQVASCHLKRVVLSIDPKYSEAFGFVQLFNLRYASLYFRSVQFHRLDASHHLRVIQTETGIDDTRIECLRRTRVMLPFPSIFFNN